MLVANTARTANDISDAVYQLYDLHDNFRSPNVYPSKFIMPQVTKDNVDDTQARLKPGRRLGLWGETQLFRKEIYNRWSEILEEQGIDPADEGLRELVFDR